MNVHELETPPRQLIEEAIDRGDAAEAKRLVALSFGDFARNKDYSINWITSLLSYIGRHMGEPAVEDALRDFGQRYLKPRRDRIAHIDSRKRMEGIVRAMKANEGQVEVSEDDEKFVMSFRCGSGGRLIDERAYEPPKDYLTLREKGPITFGRDELPVYCSHCSLNNEIQGIEWDGQPYMVQFPPTGPGERCVHWVWKEGTDIPEEFFTRMGKQKPPA
jgi:hypothetical protein